MVYATYDFYLNEYKGNAIPESDFDRLALRSSAQLDRLVGSSVANSGEPGQMAVCAVAEAIQNNEQGEVTSQSVGSWSKTVQKAEKTDEQRILEAAKLYLGDLVRTVRWA